VGTSQRDVPTSKSPDAALSSKVSAFSAGDTKNIYDNPVSAAVSWLKTIQNTFKIAKSPLKIAFKIN